MREFTTIVYTFAELDEDAQHKAVVTVQARLAGDWWDDFDIEAIGDGILYILADALGTPNADNHGPGDYPGIDGVKIDGWDIGRGETIALTGTLDRGNAPKLPWVDGIVEVNLASRRDDHTTIDIEVTDEEEDGIVPASKDEQGAMEQAIRNAMSTALSAGRAEEEYRTGEERAREWCENNEQQEYDEDGSLYN